MDAAESAGRETPEELKQPKFIPGAGRQAQFDEILRFFRKRFRKTPGIVILVQIVSYEGDRVARRDPD